MHGEDTVGLACKVVAGGRACEEGTAVGDRPEQTSTNRRLRPGPHFLIWSRHEIFS